VFRRLLFWYPLLVQRVVEVSLRVPLVSALYRLLRCVLQCPAVHAHVRSLALRNPPSELEDTGEEAENEGDGETDASTSRGIARDDRDNDSDSDSCNEMEVAGASLRGERGRDRDRDRDSHAPLATLDTLRAFLSLLMTQVRISIHIITNTMND
jgi:hypothetical protein